MTSARLLHLFRCLLCLVCTVPSHRTTTPPAPEPGKQDALRQLLLTDSPQV